MKNLFKYMLISSFLCFASNAFMQSNKVLYHYKGAASINTVNITDNVVLTFDRPIIGSYKVTGTGFYNTNIKSDEILNNKLSNVSRSIPNLSNVTFSVSDIAIEDYFLNNVLFETSSNFNANKISFKIIYGNMRTDVDVNNGLTCAQGSFPISLATTYTFPTNVRKYLDASTLVESTDASIINRANSITSGCTDLRTAILKLSQWIESNIKLDNVTKNPSTQSTIVMSSTYGDCDGASHLLAAFCRSLNIPARIVSGYSIANSFSIPISKTYNTTFGSGNGTTMSGHTVCEIYIPTQNNWIRCDPAQRTVFFGWQNFIKMATGSEQKDQLQWSCGPYYITTSQNPKPIITAADLSKSVSISSPSAGYTFIKSDNFTGTTKTNNSASLFCAADPTIPVGLNDKITIQDPPTGTTGSSGLVPDNTYSMTPCLPANFFAMFESETIPQTYSTGFDWSIVLYKANGEEYVYAQQDGLISNTNISNDYGEGCFWQPNVGVLPAYDWLYDPSGNIYGKVKVTVHISDGDTKYDETTIGVSPLNNIHDVTYSTNTTVDACAGLNLTNVTISGTPTVTFNTNGLGITINGTFEAPIGSTLIINE